MRQYLRLDPLLPDTKGEYPDGPLAAFSLVLCFGEHQPQRGRFRNRQVLSALLGRRARWIPFLIEHGDLVQHDKNVIYIDGWDEWQEGDWKVAERMKRVRERQKRQRSDTPAVTVAVTPPDTPTDTVATVTGLSEPLAVSRKPLATSEHGDVVGGGASANGLSFQQAAEKLVVPVDRDVTALCEWLLEKRGDDSFGDLPQARAEREQAKHMLELRPIADLIPWLNEQWHGTDPDDRPSSLKYFWTRLQDQQHTALKQERPHATVDGLSKITPTAPRRSR